MDTSHQNKNRNIFTIFYRSVAVEAWLTGAGWFHGKTGINLRLDGWIWCFKHQLHLDIRWRFLEIRPGTSMIWPGGFRNGTFMGIWLILIGTQFFEWWCQMSYFPWWVLQIHGNVRPPAMKVGLGLEHELPPPSKLAPRLCSPRM